MATIINQRLAHLRSLVVDDMAAMRQNIRTQLGQLGIPHVDQASTPDEAISYIRRGAYDVIICDYNLNRETNGQQMLEFLRSQNILPASTMFIMVTAETNYDLVASAAEFQPDAYMVKPLTGGKLLERIERLLDKQTALRQIIGRLNLKDVAGAVAECDRAIQAQPKWSLDIMKLKANALLELGKPEEARTVYDAALKLRDDLVWAHYGLARCHFASGQLEEAKAVAQGIIEQNAQYVMAYDMLAKVAEAQGKEQEALDALNRSYEVIPSARRSRMVGDVAYRTGNLEQARTAFDRTLKHTRGSLTAQPSDLLSLAQVHVDAGEPHAALQLLSSAPKHYAESDAFSATQAAVLAQAHIGMGDLELAQHAFERAKSLAGEARADGAALALAKAAFSIGRDDEGASILSKAVRADHENTRLVSLARKVLKDSGKEELAAEVVDGALDQVNAIVAEANALMRKAQFDESLQKLEEALQGMPENTGVLLAAAQLHLLWMSQKGLNLDYVARVNNYLAKLDTLMPGNERVAKMYRFMRETLSRAKK
ncbi:tetratricopeptide repeat protein [Noviherbaspirillum denitrificans]|uniref:Response regulator receiver protein n=1 Tax=Noviherbaspirillum denitrificans TaxID=1968433 RepID=A0A254TH42_9BURK|nr:tetratricopeptide repeat protein [Noviherbaspirillum denitrificans]OWW21477.1 response regulator receiver protein [Noviherbaspirillum denitrificans]